MSRYHVVCDDGRIRHHKLFTSKHEAQKWAHWGHFCMNPHMLIEHKGHNEFKATYI